MKPYKFKKAIPVWEKDKECEINYNLLFRTIINKTDNTYIAVSASNMYQLFVNGEMVAEGPARAGHGYYRVDEIDISKYLTRDQNIIMICVDGYYVPNFYLIRQKAFLCAEIIESGEVVAATGDKGFDAMYHHDRMRKVARYSFQRAFVEVYNYKQDYNAFMCRLEYEYTSVKLARTEEKRFIEREVPYPCYDELAVTDIVGRGTVEYTDDRSRLVMNRMLKTTKEDRGYELDELEIISSYEIEKADFTFTAHKRKAFEKSVLSANEFEMYSLEGEKTGFIKLEVKCSEDMQLQAVFDETLVDGDISINRMNSTNVIIWNLTKGSYSLITNEPYSFKYIKLINNSENAELSVSYVGVKQFIYDMEEEKLNSTNERLNKIYDAAIETFRQNTLDIYMDCPSRERAGWLCDSFFTSRVEYALTGKSVVEKNFLENFIFNDGVYGLNVPEIFPMCYPADFWDHVFIPQWAMWYVIELEEYLDRTNDIGFAEKAREKLNRLIEYFRRFENSDGLLENLESFLFVEWSKANEFTKDVNYPTNMLYARMLKAMGEIYSDDSFNKKAEKIEGKVREQSYFDGFFHDHAIRREDGNLEVIAEDITETCQYYAFFTGTATVDTYPVLWQILLNDFGPERAESELWKNIHPSNAFIGYYLRLELLAQQNEKERLLKNIEEFFIDMVENTGTLWEFNKPQASCNHGFASYVAVLIKRLVK